MNLVDPPALASGLAATRLVGALTAVPALIRQFGVDPAPIVADAGIAPALLDDPANRVRYDSLLRLLNAAALRTGCPHFGLLVGRCWHLPDMGLLGDVVRHSATVRDALNELVVHHHLNSEGALSFLQERGEFVDLGFAIYLPFDQSPLQLYDGILAATTNFMRDLCGDDWRLSKVFLPHSAPADVAPYQQYFDAPLQFDSDVCALRFRASWLTRRVLGADPQRLRLALAKAQAVGEVPVAEQAQRALRLLLLYGKTSGADVAQLLTMHKRTLDRRLNAEGTSFQQVLDRVRFAVAKELLEATQLAVPDIAVALDYADDSSFFRSFRRWAGTTPGAWRKSAR